MGIDLSVKNFISMIQESFRTFIPKDNEIRICLAIIKHLIKKNRILSIKIQSNAYNLFRWSQYYALGMF